MSRTRDDAGGALVEFLGVTVILLIPLVYLIVAVAHVQSATFAVESAARGAARSAAVAGMDALSDGATPADALDQAIGHADAALALAAHDFALAEPQLELSCTATCLTPGSDVVADVTVRVPLPGVPTAILQVAPLAVTVSARGSSPIDGLAP